MILYPCRSCGKLKQAAQGTDDIGGAIVWISNTTAEWICDACIAVGRTEGRIIEPSKVIPASVVIDPHAPMPPLKAVKQ
jgi:hypothetical protein